MPESSNDEIKEDVMELHTSLYDKFGYEMKYIRPPKGEYSERTIEYTNTLGYKTVMWSFAYDDWEEKKQGREEYGKKIVRTVTKGTGIPVTIGIAPTKTLAKIASHFGKQYAGYKNVCLIDTEEKRAKALQLTPIHEVWGIGRRLSPQLAYYGIRTAWVPTHATGN